MPTILRGASLSLVLAALSLQPACDSTTAPGGAPSGGTFQRVIGSAGTSESGRFVRETPYGYLILQTQGFFGQHTVVVKTDLRGDLISSNALRSPDSRSLIDAVATLDGGAAAIISADTLELYQFAESGAVEWSRRLVERDGMRAQAMAQMPDGGFAIIGGTGNLAEPQALRLLRTDANGAIVLDTLSPIALQNVFDLGVTVSGNLVAGGSHNVDGRSRPFVRLLDVQGELLREATLPGEGNDLTYRVAVSSDAIYAASQRGVTRLSPDGEVMWSRTLDVGLVFAMMALREGVLVAGTTSSAPYDAFMTMIDSRGGLRWTQRYGRGGDDAAEAIAQTHGGFILTGRSDASRSGTFPDPTDMLLVRTDTGGHTAPMAADAGCPDPVDPPPVPPVPASIERDWTLSRGPVNGSSFYDFAETGNGDVYAVAAYDVFRLSGDQWTIATQTPELMFGVASVGDNELVAAGTDHFLYHFDGELWEPHPSNSTPHWSYSILGAIWGSSPDNVFAGGGQGVLAHYDGTSWTQMASPVTDTILGLWGIGPQDVWAATQGGDILRYDGTAWTIAHSTSYEFRDIWGLANDLYAVGTDGAVLHCDGTSWSPLALSDADLESISGRSGTDIYIAGGKGGRGVLLHFDGNIWTDLATQVTDSPPPFRAVLAASQNRLFVSRGDNENNVYWFDGSSWHASRDYHPALNGIWAWSSTDAFAVGEKGTVLRWDGSSWTAQDTGTSGALYAVYGFAPDNVFVGGRDGSVRHFNGAVWEVMDTPASYVHDLWGSAPDNVYASGDLLMHYDGERWTDVTPPGDDILAIHGISASDIYGAGYRGVYHFDGCRWSLVQETDTGLVSVWAQPGPLVYAVGDNGTVVEYRNRRWSLLDSGTREGYTAVWGRGANDIFVSGNSMFGGYYVLRHFDGQAWTSLPAVTAMALNDLTGTEAGDVFAVGEGGVIAKANVANTRRVAIRR